MRGPGLQYGQSSSLCRIKGLKVKVEVKVKFKVKVKLLVPGQGLQNGNSPLCRIKGLKETGPVFFFQIAPNGASYDGCIQFL